MAELLFKKESLQITDLVDMAKRIGEGLSEKIQLGQQLNKGDFANLAIEVLFKEFSVTGRSDRESEYQVAEGMIIALASRINIEGRLGLFGESSLRMAIRLRMNELENSE